MQNYEPASVMDPLFDKVLNHPTRPARDPDLVQSDQQECGVVVEGSKNHLQMMQNKT